MSKQKFIPLSIILVLSLALIWVLLFWNPTNNDLTEHKKLDLASAPTGGGFTIQVKEGDLSLADLRGKVVALYFGYTTCPDICPTSLALLTQAINEMSEDEQVNFQAIFISVDPARDKVAGLADYAQYFHESIIGGTAEQKEVAKIAKLYGAAYQKVESDSAAGYLVDHSSYTYIIDKNSKLKYSLAHGTLPSEIVKVVRELLAK